MRSHKTWYILTQLDARLFDEQMAYMRGTFLLCSLTRLMHGMTTHTCTVDSVSRKTINVIASARYVLLCCTVAVENVELMFCSISLFQNDDLITQQLSFCSHSPEFCALQLVFLFV